MGNRSIEAGIWRSNWAAFLVLVFLIGNASLSFSQRSSDPWAEEGRQVSISERTIRHIEDRHWPDSPAQGAGKYAAGITVEALRDLINQAVANGRSRMNTNGRPGRIYEYDFGHPIGTTINGGPATRLRVVVNTRNQVVTAFPI